MEELYTISQNIRKIRKKLGLSQEELAEIAGVHRTFVGAIERGERNISIVTMSKLAKALKVEVIDLLLKEDK